MDIQQLSMKETEKILESIENFESGVQQSPEVEETSLESFTLNTETINTTIIEYSIINDYLFNAYINKSDDITVSNYGTVDSVGRLSFGGPFTPTRDFWYQFKFNDILDNEFIVQTKTYIDNRRDLIVELHFNCKRSVSYEEISGMIRRLKTLSFNHSKYVGKCIKVKLDGVNFKGIEIIDTYEQSNELVLTDTQIKFIKHFINRVKRGSTARYLLNGEPGTGKTESIREVVREITPYATFIIPEFKTTDDLTIILESCEIFNPVVIILDDIDLFLGSRDNGSYTKFLGEFLSFFDGVKKRKISLLASTNDKGLVDKAAERPGRFNMTLDYTYLTEEQVVKVCKIHLPKEYQIQEIYDVLTGTIDGKEVKITGAFIANLAENIKEMSEDSDNWTVDDTISLIEESYKGFYSTQISKKNSLGFKI